jgi:EAL domain-containing protein (putative c-di-GMP-specific phosphodiesterase class I)
MRERAVSRLQVETDLRNASENREFAVLYQPIISLDTGTISGFEALVRWRHPTRGLLSPADFIPIAEDTGMIGQIGRQVLIESCQQMVAWKPPSSCPNSRRSGASSSRASTSRGQSMWLRRIA